MPIEAGVRQAPVSVMPSVLPAAGPPRSPAARTRFDRAPVVFPDFSFVFPRILRFSP